MRRSIPRTAAILLGATLVINGAHAQQSSSSAPAQPPATPPASGDDNSFPEAASKQAAKAAADKKKTVDQQDADSPATPATADPANYDKSAPGNDNAFPEETSRKAADAAREANGGSGSSGASSSSASSSSSSSSSDYDDRVGGSGRNAVRLNAPMPHLNGKNPIKEDLNVGGYYLESGNFAGAYQRFKEATTLAPENTDAMFGLAEAARHLKKFDEAMSNYQLFLQVVDSGPKAKEARKAMATLEKASR